MHIKDLKLEKFKILTSESLTFVTVAAPQKEEEVKPAAEAVPGEVPAEGVPAEGAEAAAPGAEAEGKEPAGKGKEAAPAKGKEAAPAKGKAEPAAKGKEEPKGKK